MHILFIHAYFNTDKAIVSSRSFQMCKALIDRGHRVTVLSQITALNKNIFSKKAGFIRNVNIEGVEVVGVGIPYSNNMSPMIRVMSFFAFMFCSTLLALRQSRVSLVFATSTPPTVAVPALLMKWCRRIPFILELRDLWPDFIQQTGVVPWFPGWGYRILHACVDFIYRRADFITTTTPGMTSVLRSKGVGPQKLGTILLGSNYPMRKDGQRINDLLLQDNLRDKFILCYVGSISYGYKLEQLIDVARALEVVDSDVGVLIIGHGNRFELIKKLIDDEGLSNTVIHGPLEYGEVSNVLKHVHVGYESSIPTAASDHAFCNKFYDYISHGLPILSNYDGDMGSFLRYHDIGAVIKNPNLAARWIVELKSDNYRYEKLRRRIESLARKALSRDREVLKFVGVIESVAGKGAQEVKCEAPKEMMVALSEG